MNPHLSPHLPCDPRSGCRPGGGRTAPPPQTPTRSCTPSRATCTSPRPTASKGYQLTFDGGYSSPSQATNGTIGALHNGQLVRLDRSGRLLNAPINAMGSPGSASSAGIGGPYEPRILPDGTRFAYYFYVQTSFDDLENNIRWIDTGSYSTWTYADHFTSPVSESEYDRSLEQLEWLTNDRVIGAEGPYVNIATWKLGTGHGYTYQASQWWFTLQDPPDQWGVSAYHYYSDPALSPDGSKVAMTDGDGDQSDLVLAATNGPAWSGEPPYPEPDYVNMQSDVPAPTRALPDRHRRLQQPVVVVGQQHGRLRRRRRRPRDERACRSGLLEARRPVARAGRLRSRVRSRPTSTWRRSRRTARVPAVPVRPRPTPHGALTLRGLSIAPQHSESHRSGVAPRSRSGALVRFTLSRSATSDAHRERGRRIARADPDRRHRRRQLDSLHRSVRRTPARGGSLSAPRHRGDQHRARHLPGDALGRRSPP